MSNHKNCYGIQEQMQYTKLFFFLPFLTKLDLNVLYSNTYHKPVIQRCAPQ